MRISYPEEKYEYFYKNRFHFANSEEEPYLLIKPTTSEDALIARIEFKAKVTELKHASN